MRTVNKRIAGGRNLAAALLRRAVGVELDWDTRQRSRFQAVDAEGSVLEVFLPRGTVVRGGDVLVADDGSLRVVQAAVEPLLRVRACAERGTPHDLLRAAYHLGNRHVQLELRADCLLLEPDHVLAEMLRRLHLVVDACNLPFEPEAGAYGGEGGGVHAHGHRHAGATPAAAAGEVRAANDAEDDGHAHEGGHAHHDGHAHHAGHAHDGDRPHHAGHAHDGDRPHRDGQAPDAHRPHAIHVHEDIPATPKRHAHPPGSENAG